MGFAMRVINFLYDQFMLENAEFVENEVLAAKKA